MSSSSTPIYILSACELLQKYKNLELSPVEVVTVYYERIQKFNSKLNAYCHVEPLHVLLEQAKQSEQRYINGVPLQLDGIPISVKDILMCKGMSRTLFGSQAYVEKCKIDEQVSQIDQLQLDTEDHPSVQRIKEQGAIILGKVTSPEFGHMGVTFSQLHGITRNPLDISLTSGGSSGGSSAAIGAFLSPLSIGTDAGGSVRIPAAFCGQSTIKPTFARVAHAPPSAFGTLSHVGPMAYSIEDCALLLNVIGVPHLSDPYSIYPHFEKSKESFTQQLDQSIKGIKIAVSLDLGGIVTFCDKQIQNKVLEAVQVLRGLGATVDLIDDKNILPLTKFDIFKTFKALWSTGAAHLIDKKLSQPESIQKLLDSSLSDLAIQAKQFTAVDIMSCEFVRTQLGQLMNEFFTKYDILITPTLPIGPFEAELEAPKYSKEMEEALIANYSSSKAFCKEEDLKRWYTWTPYTFFFNLTKQPAVSVPCGIIEHQKIFPVGLQLAGKCYDEATILQVANAFQKATPHLSEMMNLAQNIWKA